MILHLPRLVCFSEHIIPSFTSQVFKRHFRLSMEMYEEILVRISPRLVTDHRAG